MEEAKVPTILIVEDDVLFLTTYQTHLHEEGYEVRSASSGQQALEEMEASPPDLVLLDLILPGLSGYEVLARMRANPKLAKVPVIVLTNKGEREDMKRAWEAGADGYLVKIVSPPGEVLWTIRKALSERAGQPTAMRVALREGELDAAALAAAAGKPADLHCVKCGRRLVLELLPSPDQPRSFRARLVCPKCDR